MLAAPISVGQGRKVDLLMSVNSPRALSSGGFYLQPLA